ncbi:MAG: YggT family protein [Clostridiaceae bacterium]|jgi:NADH:ubiquinone oxidoreductase subunit 6 (subunit J)|nr:YggT family protein [Clostridiaceae bacterium]
MAQEKESLHERTDNVIHITRHSSGDAVIDHDTPVWFVRAKNIIYYVLGLIETLLGLRFLFMLLGANPRSGFTAFLYAITGIFIAPFSGIFNPVSTRGLAARSVFDPATIVAMAIYALIGWGMVKLLWIRASKNGY